MFRELRTSLSLFLIFSALTGFGYPLLMLAAGSGLFPYQAQGSLIESNGQILGSHLIGQNFSKDGYFHPRPSSAGADGYDAANSSGSNLATTSPDLMKVVTDRVESLRKDNPGKIPVDLVTASGSGLDPDISVDAANFQLGRVAAARGLVPAQIEELIAQMTHKRTLGFLGEKRVNVLEINQALDRMTGSAKVP